MTHSVALVENFDRLPIPFRAVATDLETGEMVVLGSGNLATAIRASMSIPGVYAPAKLDGRLLVDGGVANNLPVSVAREMGASEARTHAVELNPLRVANEAWQAYRSRLASSNHSAGVIVGIEVEHERRLGYYETVSYSQSPSPDGTRLIIKVQEKSWGPNYLSFGLNYEDNFDGDTQFNLASSLRVTELNELGGNAEARFTYVRGYATVDEQIGTAATPEGAVHQGNISLQMVHDSLDDPFFPREGAFAGLRGRVEREGLGSDRHFDSITGMALGTGSWKGFTLTGLFLPIR